LTQGGPVPALDPCALCHPITTRGPKEITMTAPAVLRIPSKIRTPWLMSGGGTRVGALLAAGLPAGLLADADSTAGHACVHDRRVVVVQWAAPSRLLLRRDHRGRMLSLAINYLGFMVCLALDLHILGVYVGLDVLAGTFKYGLPFLLLGFIGYLIGAWGDRYEDYPQRQQSFRRLSQTIIVIAAGLWVLSVGSLEGIIALLQQFNSPLPFILTAGIVVFAVLLRAVWRRSAAEVLHAKRNHEETLNGLLFLSPNLLGFLLFFAAPLLFSLLISFTNSDAFNPPDWVGLQNYQQLLNVTLQPLSSPTQLANEVLDMKVYDELARLTVFGQSYVIGAQDKLFWLALRNTIMYCLMAVPFSVIRAAAATLPFVSRRA
jgi:hypothetical protein